MKYKHAIALWHNWLVEKVIWTDNWIVRVPFVWYIDFTNKLWKIEISEGFVTNFWSIPRLFRIFINPTKYISYILHDHMWQPEVNISFKESNVILKEAMEVEWAGIIERNLVYIALQYTIFPYYHFVKCKKVL